MKLEIKSTYGTVLYSGEAASTRKLLLNAIKDHADLRSADLSGANLSDAYLSGADLRGADLRGADLRGAYLRGANLRSADLSGADLRGAYLSGANLSDANLRSADLRGANLSGANLSDANLRSADLRGANLRGAKGVNPNLICQLRFLLDQPGTIRLYKLVQGNGDSPMSRDNGYAPINYVIGERYEITDADTSDYLCAGGINVATLDWCMSNWRAGWRIFTVDFTASDIASIPTATDGKIRLFRCTVTGQVDLEKIGLVSKDKEAEAV